MMELERVIKDEIRARGPMTFARFMDLALYHPEHGYYSSGRASIGRAGDFYTSPHVSPVFGRLVLETFLKLKSHMREEDCAFVEVGAGAGWLARDFLSALERHHHKEASGFRYFIVEAAPGMAAKQRDTLGGLAGKVTWRGSLAGLPDGLTGVIFSNELLDSLPFHRVCQDRDALHELCVHAGPGGFVEVARPLSTPEIPRHLNTIGVRLKEGVKAEVCLDAKRWVREAASRLSRGFVITVDYGYPAREYYNPARAGGTIMCYHKHAATEDPYALVGEQDITAHVDFSSIALGGHDAGLVPVLFADQGQFLLDAAVRVEELLKAGPDAQAGLDELGQGLKPLVHPEWMGGAFKVLVQAKGVDAGGLFDGVKNRLDELFARGSDDSFSLS